MSSNTHSAHYIGENASVFIDGIPDQCEHDDDGEALLFNNEWQYFKQSEAGESFEEIEAFHKLHNISGGCTSCSKCGKPSFNSGTMFE